MIFGVWTRRQRRRTLCRPAGAADRERDRSLCLCVCNIVHFSCVWGCPDRECREFAARVYVVRNYRR